uniref:Nucleoside diphosphatase n=1 Tax=Steinernema glaseri TaxID=37863 RepID=A0A1I7YWD0_9BILA
MLSGTDEGVFSWFTLNVLVDRMKHVVSGNFGSAAAALDLGGGSTQLTFIPKRPAEAFADVEEADFAHTINVFGTDVKLYTHSYLGNGLVAARLGMAQDTEGSEGSELRTHCLPKGYALKDWDYAGTAWKVRGTEAPSFEACLRSAEEYVEERTKVKKVPELADKNIYVFSYFYDRGVQGGLVPKTEGNLGGISTVGGYKKAAKKACALPADQLGPEHWRPWQCLDLTYIYALLHHGYGLPDDKELFLAEKNIYVFSYFYDRGVQGGLVPKTEGNLGGISTVGGYKKAAKKACALPADQLGPEHWRPWQCLDLTYIYALLHHGYGLPDDKELFLAKRLKKMEMSWALGASYHLLNSYHADYNIKYTESRRQNPAPSPSDGRPNTTQNGVLDEVFEFMSESLTSMLSYFNLISPSA